MASPLVFPLVIEGSKGAGKSTTIEKLASALGQNGIGVATCAPFAAANLYAQRRGFASAVAMISASCAANREEIEFIGLTMKDALQNAVQQAEQDQKPSVLIYDRGWMTLRPHLFGGYWFAHHPEDHAAIEDRWQGILASAPPTVFLHAGIEVTRARRSLANPLEAARLEESGLAQDKLLRMDIEGRRALAAQHSDKIALSFDTGVVAQDEVVAAILAHIHKQMSVASPLCALG